MSQSMQIAGSKFYARFYALIVACPSSGVRLGAVWELRSAWWECTTTTTESAMACRSNRTVPLILSQLCKHHTAIASQHIKHPDTTTERKQKRREVLLFHKSALCSCPMLRMRRPVVMPASLLTAT